MAESAIAGDYEFHGAVVPMILSEGTLTVSSRVYSTRGLYDVGVTFAKELQKGDPIAFAYGETLTYDNTGGLGAATRIAAGTGYQMRGRIVSEPRWISSPPTTAGSYGNFASNVTNKYFRIADVELWGVQKVHAVKHTTNNSSALTLGNSGKIAVSAASSYAAHKICIEDLAAAGSGSAAAFVCLTYRASAAAGTAYTDLIGSPSGIYAPVNT